MSLIPHIELLYECHESISPIQSLIEPLYSYLYCLNTRIGKDRKKPSGFYFLLENRLGSPFSVNALVDLYRSVTSTTVILSELEKHQDDYTPFPELNQWLLAMTALKNQVGDISKEIKKLKNDGGVIYEKPLCRKLFLYVESVRALLEELLSLKKTLLGEVVGANRPFLTKEPLDMKGDLE